MKPVYFPHTYLAPAAADALRKLFASVAVYQPVAGRVPEEMQPLAADGFLEVVAPAPGDASDFDRLIRDFEEWGRLHRNGTGLEAALRHGHSFWGPAGADGSTFEIASQLRRRATPQSAADAGLAARVFLQLAQTADQQRHQIAGDLARFDEAHARLFAALKGEADPAASGLEPSKGPVAEDDGDDRLVLRTAAWARLFLDLPYPSPVFVTHSAGLIRHLAETVPGRLRVSREALCRAAGKTLSSPPSPTDDVLALLSGLAAGAFPVEDLPSDETKQTSPGNPAEEACFHVWPELSPFGFFNRLLASGPGCGQPPPQAPWRHTVLVQLRCHVGNK
ncbi:MAG: hypothetical protein MUC33_06965 [Desulfobacterales bacterium]|jgi:hypothetical protein|nr:hypothetical protein [Desulfobacterales bacterium]